MTNQLDVIVNKNAEDYKAWLRYQHNPKVDQLNFTNTIVFSGEQSPVIQSAIKELMRGLTGISGVSPAVINEHQDGNLIQLALLEQAPEVIQDHLKQGLIHKESYAIKLHKDNGNETLYVIGKTDKGILYGSFHLLRLLQQERPVFDIIESPKNNLRMLNHWDNMDGSIERGYAGESIFYKDYQFVEDFERIKDYARLLASVGINGVSINNVNVHQIETNLITPEYLPDVAIVAKVFRSYGIQLFLSVNYASSIELGGLDTADPLDKDVKEFWKKQAAVIYEYIPDFGGFIVKADSEHRPGPFTYDRNHADGANMLAEALLPYNGLVIWRCFVYNCLQDWRDRETDRARAAYDHFKPLDGEFMDNVILQIKNGPMDFQVREAISPLFGAMPKTNQMLELQITQEYTGQQKDLFYLIPQWKEVLDFETYAKGEGSTVKRIVDGSIFPYKNCGITAVVNVGNDQNWTGHPLAQANLYGYGRLTWDPDRAADDITFEWIAQTFGHDAVVQEQIKKMLDDSGQIYENYTAPLGVGWMVNPHHHYGPNVDGYEYSVWGTYHFADLHGIGVDRTVKSGTGYTAQYFEENAQMYESLDTCPDELLLFFHHVPYTHRLKSGETVIQHIYNTHFDGVEQAKELIERWDQLEGKIDEKKYNDVLDRLNMQVENAKEWRDIINTYFYRKSGIADELNRKIY